MKAKQLLMLSVLALGVQSVAQATYPADAEWSQYDFERPVLMKEKSSALESGAAGESWGVSKRELESNDPFPFGANYIDD